MNKKIILSLLFSCVSLSYAEQTFEQLFAKAFVCYNQNEYEQALDYFQQASLLKPESIETKNNCAYLLKQLSRMYEALSYYQQVLAFKPDHVGAHIGIAQAYLATGNFKQGLKELEWRLNPISSEAQVCKWYLESGKSLQGKTVLIQTEWGIGDVIQYVRYASVIKSQGGIVKLALIHQSLVPLLLHHPDIDELIKPGESLPPAHFHVPMVSLPFIFGTTLDTIPNDVPYLWADEKRVATWKKTLAHDTNIKIGICWYGNANHDEKKFMPLHYLTQLAALPNVSLYSLQKIHGLEQLEKLGDVSVIKTFGPDFDATPFMDTAAIMKNLDLVITVDTSVAHLAGALGVQTWLLLAHAANWRWMLDRDDSPWYPTMKLFRQKEPGDWQGVVNAIKKELERKLE